MTSLYDSNGRKEWVDLGKGISILLVVLFHCEEYLPIVETGTKEIFSFFRMPFFFFLSGYVFTSDYKAFSLRRKLKQILRGIVWTYLIFTLILVVPKSLSNGESVVDGLEMIALGYASWFVVSLGVAQLMFALFLSRYKGLKQIALFVFCCVAAGVAIKHLTDDTLPYQFEKALFVVFYLSLGFFYRIYEDRIKSFFKARYLLLAVVLYAALMWVERACLDGNTSNVFWGNGSNNLPFFFLYTLAGIGMMLQIVKNVDAKKLKMICYIGSNSLIFYYLNGGVIKVWRYVYNRFESSGLLENNWFSFFLIFFLACAALFAIVYLVKRYCPLLVGDKKSFNRCFPKYKW